MVRMEREYGTVFVAASGNAPPDDGAPPGEDPGVFEESDSMPYEAQPYVPGMMVVGATTREGDRRPLSKVGSFVEVYAPGDNLPYPLGVAQNRRNSGTSPGMEPHTNLVYMPCLTFP